MHQQNGLTVVYNRREADVFERLVSPCCGLLIGFLFIPSSLYLVYYSESQSVSNDVYLREVLSKVYHLETTEVAFKENNGRLVHLNGILKTDQILTDNFYSISVKASKLKRIVEMYQWEQHGTIRNSEPLPGPFKEYIAEGHSNEAITYFYVQGWSSKLIESSKFYQPDDHENPDSMPIRSETFVAHPIKVGNFHLSKELINQINNFKPLPAQFWSKKEMYFDELGYIYEGTDPSNPQIGDIRVKYEYAGASGWNEKELGPATMVSIIARQLNNELLKFKLSSGTFLELLYTADLTAEEILAAELDRNRLYLWGFRLLAWILMFIGFQCGLIYYIVSWLPLIPRMIRMGLTAINLCLSFSVTLLVIGFCWLIHKPVYAGCFLLIAVLPWISRTKGSSIKHRD